MAFNGSGTYVRVENWTNDAASNLPINAPKFDAEANDMAAALTLCLTRDGQGKPTAALTWLQSLTLSPVSTVPLTLNSPSGVDALDINLTQAAGVGWAINIAGSINTDVRGVQLVNSNSGTGAALVGLAMGNSGSDEMLVGITGANFAGSKFAGGPTGEVGYIWGGNTMPLVLGYGTGGAPKAAAIVTGATTETFYFADSIAANGIRVAFRQGAAGAAFIGGIGNGPTTFVGAALADFGFTGGSGKTLIGYNGGNNTAISIAGGVSGGAVTINPAGSGTTLSVNGVANNQTANIIANTTNAQSFGLNIQAGTISTDWALAIQNAALNANLLKVWGDGHVTFPSVGTTASAANAFLDNSNSNNLLRSTSSIRYKQDVTSLVVHWDTLMSLRPVRYRSKAPADDPQRYHYGLIAEQVAEVDRSLVNFDEHGAPDGVQYDRVSVLLLAAFQQLAREFHHGLN